MSEQERLLQEKLQQLARSDNARLTEIENSSVTNSRANSRPSSYIAPKSGLEKSNSISIKAAFQKSHQRTRSLQPYFNSDDKVPALSVPRTPQSRAQSPVRSPLKSPVRSSMAPIFSPPVTKEAARAAALAKLSGDIEPKVSLKPILAPLVIESEPLGLKRRLSVQSPGQFVISSNDILKLGNDGDNEEGEDEQAKKTSRPNDLGGNVLSWRMAGDIVRTSGKVYKSPETLYEVLRYLWILFSNPSTMTDVNISESQWLPPAEVVTSLKDNLMAALMQTSMKNLSDAFIELLKIVGRGACTGLAFTIIFFQVSLISMMVIAYVLGDILMCPFKYVKRKIYNEPKAEAPAEIESPKTGELSPEELGKPDIRKIQRAARKAILRRSKRRSRHA